MPLEWINWINLFYYRSWAHKTFIIDLSENGSQPMLYENHWICFNGEVYNFSSIKKLSVLGHVFEGNLIPKLFFMHMLNGKRVSWKIYWDVCFCYLWHKIWKLFLCERQSGVKPFYYYFEILVLFSSELKAFHKHPKFQKT